MTLSVFIVLVIVTVLAFRLSPAIGSVIGFFVTLGLVICFCYGVGSWWSHHFGAEARIHVTYEEIPGEDNQSYVVHIDNQSGKTVRNFRMICTNGPTIVLDDVPPHSHMDGTARFTDILPHHACEPDYHVVAPNSTED